MRIVRFLKIAWRLSKEKRQDKKLSKNIDKVFNCLSVPREKLLVTDEIVYGISFKGRYKESRLPIITTNALLKVTQLSCNPLEFQPRLRWYI